MREAANAWSVLAERCYPALDHSRVRFQDVDGRCPVAAAPLIAVGVGVCLLAAAEFAAEVVVVTGTVMLAGELAVELGLLERGASGTRDVVRPPAPAPALRVGSEPGAEPRPRGGDWYPPPPPSPPQPDEERCRPQRVRPLGGSELHNTCANRVPGNAFPGANVIVNGKAFDALAETATAPGYATFVLWEVKTGEIEKYNDFILLVDLANQAAELRRQQLLAWACGYRFAVGVRNEALKDALEKAEPRLKSSIIIMWWC